MIQGRTRGVTRVLGIDPGLAKAGWGVVEIAASRLKLIEYGVIRTSTDLAHSERLLKLFSELQCVVERFAPDTVAVEEVFQGKSPRSALLAGEGRAACILAGGTRGLRVVEYPASVIKQSVTGNGRAAKIQVQNMVQRLLGLNELPRPHDSADALAVALTHIQRGHRGLRTI